MSIEAHHSQLTAEGYVRLLCPSDSILIDTDYRYAEAREKRGKRDRERSRQREVGLVGEKLSGCKWNNVSMNMPRNQ